MEYISIAKKKQVNRKQNLDFLIDRSFPGVNRYFLLSFENDDGWESHIQYYLPTVEIKDYMLWSMGEISFFNQLNMN